MTNKACIQPVEFPIGVIFKLITCIIMLVGGSLACSEFSPEELVKPSAQVSLKVTESDIRDTTVTNPLFQSLTSSPNKTATKRVVTITPTSTATITPSSSPSPTSTEKPPTVTPSLTSTPTPTEITSGLPGLNPADLTVNLENKNFNCTDAQRISGGYVWTCDRETSSYWMRVDIYSFTTIMRVDFIDAGIIFTASHDDDLASSFLGYVATAPYDNADPSAAREWVEITLPTITTQGDVREAVFGGVTFQLFGGPSARYLEFGDLNEE